MSLVRIVAPPARPPGLLRRGLRSDAVMAVASPVLILMLWEALVRSGLLDARFFPAPSTVLVELEALLASGALLRDTGWTVSRVAVGFVLGAVPGVLLGLAMGLSPVLRAFLRPAVGALYPIPKVALFPLVMLVFGLGETSKWVIVAVAVFFQVLLSTLSGVVNIEPIYLDVARNFGAGRWQAVRRVALPAALPFIFTGCQLGLGMALIVVVIAEQVGTKAGLGYLIWRSWQVFEVPDMYAGLLVIAVLGYLVQLGMGRLERVLIRWKPAAGGVTSMIKGSGRWVGLVLLLSGLAAGAARAADKVNVSVFQSVSDAGIYIALDRGYFAAEGIEVSLSQLDATTLVDTALASGQIDVAGGAPSAGVYNSIRQGVPLRIVADKGSMPPGHGYLGLVVRQGLVGTIKTPADLRGHRIAWAAYDVGGTNAVVLDHLLRMGGLTLADVDAVNLTFGDSLAALASGGVDAAYLIEPLMQAAASRGIGQVLMTGDQMYPGQQVAVLLYGPGLWQKRPAVAQRFMAAYLHGVRDYDDAFDGRADRASVVAILAAHTTVKTLALYDHMVMPGLRRDGRVNLPGMQDDLRWFQATGLVKGRLEEGQLFDPQFVDAAGPH